MAFHFSAVAGCYLLSSVLLLCFVGPSPLFLWIMGLPAKEADFGEHPIGWPSSSDLGQSSRNRGLKIGRRDPSAAQGRAGCSVTPW